MVNCDEQIQIDRLLKRNPQLTINDAKARINSQMRNSERVKLAHYCIDNSNTIYETKIQIQKVYNVIKKSNNL